MLPTPFRLIAPSLRVLVSGAVLLVSAGTLEARQDPLVGGIVLDEETELPIPGATIRIESIDTETETREDGRFGYYEVPPGPVTVRVQAPERAVVVEELEVGPEDIVFVRFLLPGLAAVLSEIVGGFEGSGTLPPPGPDATAADLVEARLPPGIQLVVGGARETAPRLRLRGENRLRPAGGPSVFLDGIRVGDLERALDVLSQIPASHVEEVEVLRGPSAAFLHALAADGVIMVTTRAGTDGLDPPAVEPDTPAPSAP
ncbi:MAG: TonB-dependent receptor plug domain-containing protein [Gammaproteobacteria bacterium]|nr:TonB-dependent receptor plug domain-containing protein [Gammaproteobacteria bacterium]MDE0248701.1 TonB-dependent receptor plug domain-containing protein [Gammaproteobacteria bacterium]